MDKMRPSLIPFQSFWGRRVPLEQVMVQTIASSLMNPKIYKKKGENKSLLLLELRLYLMIRMVVWNVCAHTCLRVLEIQRSIAYILFQSYLKDKTENVFLELLYKSLLYECTSLPFIYINLCHSHDINVTEKRTTTYVRCMSRFH